MYFKPDLFVVRTMVHYVRIRQYRIRIHACLRMAMPPTHRTNDHTTQSLALTNGSTFGELLLLVGNGAHIRCFLRHADNHQRHVSGRRLLAQLSLRNLLPMVFKSRLCHNMIPLSVKIRKHAVSPCAQHASW